VFVRVCWRAGKENQAENQQQKLIIIRESGLLTHIQKGENPARKQLRYISSSQTISSKHWKRGGKKN